MSAREHRRHDAHEEQAPRHRGPAVPDGEITTSAALRNVVTRHGSRTYLFIVFMAALLGRLAYDSFVGGGWPWGAAYAAIGVLTVALFVVDSAQLRAVRRNARLRWLVRAWWLLFPLLIVVAYF